MGNRHHYVPRFYLRNFSIRGRDKFVWVYKRNEPPKDLNISRVAVKKGFYNFPDKETGQKNSEVEKFYDKSTESPTAPVIKKIIAMDDISLSDDERETIAHFVAHLITRNPRYRTIQEKYLDKDYDFIKYLEIQVAS
jgi:hypothetical protein